SFRQQNVRAEINRAAPEPTEQFALNADVVDVLRLGRRRNGRDDLVELQRKRWDPKPGVDPDPSRRAVEIPGLSLPVLALTHVGRELHDVSVRAMLGLVSIE